MELKEIIKYIKENAIDLTGLSPDMILNCATNIYLNQPHQPQERKGTPPKIEENNTPSLKQINETAKKLIKNIEDKKEKQWKN